MHEAVLEVGTLAGDEAHGSGQIVLAPGGLEALTRSGKTAASKFIHARGLLLCDAGMLGAIDNPNAVALTVNYKNGEVKGSFLLNPTS